MAELIYIPEEGPKGACYCKSCGKMLSQTKPVCFSCPIYLPEYYERQNKLKQERQI